MTVPILNAPVIERVIRGAGLSIVAWMSALAVRRIYPDAQWAILATAALLLSPLANVYYGLVALGPIIAVAYASPRTLWWRAGVLLCAPYALVVGGWHHSALLTASVGSIYSWGTIATWWLCCRARQRIGVLPAEQKQRCDGIELQPSA